MQACVVDSCSFLHSFHIAVGDHTLSDLVANYFDAIVHTEVVREVDSVLPRTYPSWKAMGLVTDEMGDIRRRHSEWRVNAVREAEFESSEFLAREKVDHLDAGERACLQLTKEVSDKDGAYVLFWSDDFDAGEAAKKLFDKYQCGFVLRSADLITFFGLRLGITKHEIKQALRDLLAFYTGEFELVRTELERLLPKKHAVVIAQLDRAEFDKAQQTLWQMGVPKKERVYLRKRIAGLQQLLSGGIVAHTISRINALAELQV